jgi:hypothetical protein
LTTRNPATGENDITRILVRCYYNTKGQRQWDVVGHTDDPLGLCLWRHGILDEELAAADVYLAEKELDTPFNIPVESRDERVLMLFGRVVIGACIAMSNKDAYTVKIRSNKKLKKRGIRKEELPTANYVLGAPIKIDCRPAIREYLEGTGSRRAPAVRFLVRGHWKRVAHGPKHSLRKWQVIEPYWKNNVSRTTLVRPTVLTSENSSSTAS